MSTDPKKPLDPAPDETPDLLQRELDLDRRKRVPSFDELTNTNAPPPAKPDPRTLPGTPGPFSSAHGPARTQLAPAGTMTPGNPARQPSGFESAMTAQSPQLPQQRQPPPRAPVAVPPGLHQRPPAPPAIPRVQVAQPTQAPPQPMSPSGRHPPPHLGPAPVRAQPLPVSNDVTRPGVHPQQPPNRRTAPPSPNEWAAARGPMRPEAPTVPVAPVSLPRVSVTPAMQGATRDAEQPKPPSYAQPHVPVARAPAPQPAQEFITAPQRPVVHLPPELESEGVPAMSPNLLTTQPSMPNPYKAPRAPEPAPRIEELPTASRRRDTPKADTLQAPAEPVPAPATRKVEPVSAAAAGSTRLEPALNPAVNTTRRVQPVAAPERDEVTASPASLWRRTFAWVMDLVVITAVVGGFFAAALAVIGKPSPSLLLSVALPALGVVGFVAFVYTTLFAFLWRGRTLGRLLFGIHLVDSTGQAPGVGRALVRAVLSLASFALCLSGFWLALFDRKGQTLHDKLTSTFVVRLRPAA